MLLNRSPLVIASPFTPALATKVDFATGAGARVVAAGDVNRDVKRDLAVTNEIAGTVSVLLGQ